MINKLFDLRGLNYKFKTGVNTVNLHILYLLLGNSNIKSLNFLGLGQDRLQELEKEFNWISQIKQNNIQNSDYSGKKYLNQTLANADLITQFYLNLKPKNQKFDLIYQAQPKPLPIPANTKFITTFHDLSVVLSVNRRSGISRNNFLENKITYTRLANQASKIIASSYSTAYDIVKHLKVPESKVEVIYLALPNWERLYKDKLELGLEIDVSLKEINPNLNKDNYFLAISGYEFRKNFHNLILAWHKFQNQHPSLASDKYLVIAGSLVDLKYYQYLLKLKAELEIRNLVLLTEINLEQKNCLLSNCTALVYPSLYEGFGFPILEANKFGKGVITSFNSSMPEVSGRTGFLVNPMITDQIADSFYIYLTDTTLRLELENNTAKNLSRFSWSEYETRLSQLLN
ncbi:MAG: glycosyltransferase family 1 protein [Patescibacteria group bacterium]